MNNTLFLIPVLWTIGLCLKKIPIISDTSIPWLLLVFGIAGSQFIMGYTDEASLQGIFIAGVSVLGHQLVKQAGKRVKNE